MKVRDLSIPPGWRFTRNTTVLYLRGPDRNHQGSSLAWCVERLVRGGKKVKFSSGATSTTSDRWAPVLVDEELKRNTGYRLRRGMVVIDWPK